MDEFPIPRDLAAAARAEHREDWLTKLPERVRELTQRWSLIVGAPYEPGGQTAWVAPVRSGDFGDAVLKVQWRHTEATHEADALRYWDGDGAVRVYDDVDDDDAIVLLIERCVPGALLGSRPQDEQDVVIAELLQRLWRAPPPAHRFRALQTMCEEWADAFERTDVATPARLDPGLVRDGLTLFRALPASAEREVVLCTDLHAGNVLAATRAPWLAIDPNPYVGDPTYDALQHLLNCDTRLRDDPRALVRRMADLLGLDEQRLRAWLFARCVVEAVDWPGLGRVARRIAPT
jgi:streptomycin 6-kinase